MSEIRQVIVVGYPAAELLDIACITSALQIANWLHGSALYDIKLATRGGRAIECASGLTVQAQARLESVRGPLDTVIISGGIGHEDAADDRHLVAHVRRLARESRRVASVCTGAAVLAATGLVDGRRVATHWHHVPTIAADYPAVNFDPGPIYIRDDQFATSAGVTAALDLTLAFIEEDAGADLARSVARQLVTYLQRPGNQAQMSMFTAPPAALHTLVQRTVDHIAAHLDADLSAAALAARAGISERHLTRLFLREVEHTPGRFVRRARTEAAAQLLVTTSLTMGAIASRCGFGTAETLRQAFLAHYGVSPSHYRLTQSLAVGSGVDALPVQVSG
ncbi:GlxA family transcriptional regulator [Luteipulveratus mongoliensis]|uniref:AraC family transcriptional regulator n=1 Tax=Luteipulveratus mongoliensis TaxID=571913 RepID=A0A0K1JKK4_9MICO|nr:helix-turn-helix domain-containing protein [Luteipulveratus mongoliensis]AKU17128.1 AraC family transcriptional regulator [Luteipulveratus mongoliensis]